MFVASFDDLLPPVNLLYKHMSFFSSNKRNVFIFISQCFGQLFLKKRIGTYTTLFKIITAFRIEVDKCQSMEIKVLFFFFWRRGVLFERTVINISC